MNPGCIGEKESIPKLLPLDKADFFYFFWGESVGGRECVLPQHFGLSCKALDPKDLDWGADTEGWAELRPHSA